MSRSIVLPALFAFCAVTIAGFCDDKSKSSKEPEKKDAGPRIISTVDVKPLSVLSDRDAREVSFAAGKILKHVTQAKSALQDKKLDHAKSHIVQGLKLAAIVDGLLPRFLVKTEIKSGDHVYFDEDQVTPEYVMIFTEVERRDIISPVLQAKHEHATRKNQRHAAATSSPDSKEPEYVIAHEGVRFSAAKLNVPLATRLLHAAETQLKEGQPQAAEASLAEFLTSAVVFEYSEIDLPLREAAGNLKIAEREIAVGHLDHAKAALKLAGDQLKQYETKVGTQLSAEVKALRTEIDTLTVMLDKGPLAPLELQKWAETISGWWDRATKWFQTQK